jgi:protein TonB
MPFPVFAHRQTVGVVACVLLLHGLALWGLHSGLLQRTALAVQDVVVQASVVIEAPARPPTPVPPTPSQPTPAPRLPRTLAPPVAATPPVAPAALPVVDTHAPSPALAAALQPAPAAAAPTAPPAPLPLAAPPAAAAKLELPSSNADYLQNPKADYPRLSRQRNEQGRVLVRVLIGTDGTAQQAEIQVSSGFERLDQAALATVRSWRYVPGKRGGVPEAMWFNVPINFVLE